MAFPIAPWLDVKPRDFVEAAQSGAALGLKQSAQADEAAASRARTALEAQRIAQDSMADQARIALAERTLAATEKQHAVESKVQQEQTEKKFLYDQQRNAISDAYKMATLGLAKTKLEDATKQAALVGAHKQGFAQAIASGKTPAEAAAMYPLAMTTGVATQIAKPPTNRTDMETVVERYPGVDPVEARDGFFGLGAREAVPGKPPTTVTYKRQREGASPIPESLKLPSAPSLKFIRDGSGNLVPATQ